VKRKKMKKETMQDLFSHLCPEQAPSALRDLDSDEETRPLLRQQLGRRLLECSRPLASEPLDQILLITSQAAFASDEEEAVLVARFLHGHLRTMDILPMVSHHRGLDLGSRCLVALALFYPAMVWRWQYHGMPRPQFYRQAGESSLLQAGQDDLASHFLQWESFLAEMLPG
jgi:hypothetical protein